MSEDEVVATSSGRIVSSKKNGLLINSLSLGFKIGDKEAMVEFNLLPFVMTFGDGDIGVGSGPFSGVKGEYCLSLTNLEKPAKVGERVLVDNYGDSDEGCFIRMVFKDVGSVDVVMAQLAMVRAALVASKE